MLLASVSVDLDALSCYHTIHGLHPPDPELADVVLRRALPRFLDLFGRHRICGTLFVVGADVDGATRTGRDLLREAAQGGHELGNHSYSHPYNLAKFVGTEAIYDEVVRCDRVLRGLCATPRGFRSPGYDMSPALFEVIEDLGYLYDSSLFPSWPYYGAKALVMAGQFVKRLLFGGTPSAARAVLTTPQALLCPADPYRANTQAPWKRGQSPVVELPVAVTPRLRLPAIGTSLVLSEGLRRHLVASMEKRPFFNLELHGIDLIDAKEDGISQELVQKQPDLRIPLSRKLQALDQTLRSLRKTRDLLPLWQVANQVQRAGSLTY